jgi:polysaccharide biosynthesis protein PelA
MLKFMNAPLTSIATAMIITCCTLLLFAAHTAYAQAEDRYIQKDKKWIVYYANTEESLAFVDYNIIVFDRDKHPSLQNLQSRGSVIFAYMSLGEAEKDRADYEEVKHLILPSEENPHWKGRYAVDVRDPDWTRYLIEDVIPHIVEQGFDGIFLDTLDRAEELERSQPQRYSGMIKAASNIIRAIHYNYPHLKIMTNRGFAVLPHVLSDIDYILVESILVNYDHKNGNHALFPDSTYEQLVDTVQGFKKKAPHLKILSLDYWNMDDTDTVKAIYQRQRMQGFLPYVTSIELNRIHAEPQ